MRQLTPLVFEPDNPDHLWDLHRDGVTQGALANWLLCPVKAHLRLHRGLMLEGSKQAIEFGNVIHRNLEMTYQWYANLVAVHGQSIPSIYDVGNQALYHLELQEREALQQVSLALGSTRMADEMELVYGMAVPILESYYAQWPIDFKDREWVSLEKEFDLEYNVPLTADVRLRGKIDGVFRQSKGAKSLWLVDHKSKARFDENVTVQRLNIDLQMGIYCWAVQQLYGEPIGGFIYNMIRRPQLRQKQGETRYAFLDRIRQDVHARPEWYFIRMEVALTERDHMMYAQNLARIMRAFYEWSIGEGPHYMNTVSCHNGMYACEYLPICSGEGDGNFIRREQVFPELSL